MPAAGHTVQLGAVLRPQRTSACYRHPAPVARRRALSRDDLARFSPQAGVSEEPKQQNRSASLQHALPAVAPDAKTGGFLSSLFGGGSRVETPMTDPLPGVHLPAHTAAPAQPPTTDFTTLSNGVKIASENIPVRAAGHR